MDVDDFFEAEVAAAVAATAALFSPKVRHVLRRGAVYGVAGVMMAGDAIVGAARGVGKGVQQARHQGAEGVHPPEASTTAEARPAEGAKGKKSHERSTQPTTTE